MIPISTDVEKIFQPGQLREDEYLDEESNLIYCSKCRTPRQNRFEMCGKVYEPRCMCSCQKAAYDQREQERKHREFLDLVSKNRSMGLPDPELRKHTFENDLGYNQEQMKKAKHRLEEAEARNRVKERKARTRRLIQEGAILESVFPQVQHLEPDALKAILEKRFGLETEKCGS